jgi:hypothetical protein
VATKSPSRKKKNHLGGCQVSKRGKKTWWLLGLQAKTLINKIALVAARSPSEGKKQKLIWWPQGLRLNGHQVSRNNLVAAKSSKWEKKEKKKISSH